MNHAKVETVVYFRLIINTMMIITRYEEVGSRD